jgi:hypothetical protein
MMNLYAQAMNRLSPRSTPNLCDDRDHYVRRDLVSQVISSGPASLSWPLQRQASAWATRSSILCSCLAPARSRSISHQPSRHLGGERRTVRHIVRSRNRDHLSSLDLSQPPAN